MTAALDGVRVLELTHAIAGPHTGQILADHGADVIKVEPPGGELARMALPVDGEDSVYFAAQNRGKRSVVLDLKDAEGLALFLRLVEDADVVLTNYSAEVPDRLGWGFETLKAVNPSIIMVHITGFGSASPDRSLLAFDAIIQCMSGIPDITGLPDGDPTLVGTFVADHLTAYRATMSILMALRVREADPQAQLVDVDMLSTYMRLLAHDVHESLEGRPYRREGNRAPVSIGNTFRTMDGFVHLAPVGDPKWAAFCREIGRDDWAGSLSYEDAVLVARDEVDEFVAAWCRTRTNDDILARMARLSIPAGPVRELAEAVRRLDERGDDSVVRVTSPTGRPVAAPGPMTSVGLSSSERRLRVPAIGEHTDEVLAGIRGVRATGT